MYIITVSLCKKGKAIPLAGHKGPWGSEMSRFQHFLDNRLTDGSTKIKHMLISSSSSLAIQPFSSQSLAYKILPDLSCESEYPVSHLWIS
jgi:hypothetical protein